MAELTTVEHLRKEHREAHDRLRRFKLRELQPWKHETWEHYHRRQHQYRMRRKNLRRIDEHLEARLKHAIERKEDRKEEKKDKGPYDPHGGGVVTFDGKPCVEWIAYWLLKARQHGWKGILVSGYRSPEYSESLCIRMCGHTSCPGTCAGRSSNHTRTGYLGGAADVTDYLNCERIMHEIGSPLKNNLPYDLVHLSASGY